MTSAPVTNPSPSKRAGQSAALLVRELTSWAGALLTLDLGESATLQKYFCLTLATFLHAFCGFTRKGTIYGVDFSAS